MRLMAVLSLLLTVGCCQTAHPTSSFHAADDEHPWAIRGTIVTADDAREGWLVFDRGGITRVHCPIAELPQNAHRIEYDGYIFPNLIDTHNHAQWNVIPQWRAGKTFESRYGWLDDPAYKKAVNEVFATSIREKKLEYAALKYAEIRSIIGATTLIQTTYPVPEPHFLARNLDSTYGADSRIQDITRISEEEVHRFRTGLSSGRTRRIFLHIGEGKDSNAKCAQEFGVAREKGLVRPGLVIIHGVALKGIFP